MPHYYSVVFIAHIHVRLAGIKYAFLYVIVGNGFDKDVESLENLQQVIFVYIRCPDVQNVSGGVVIQFDKAVVVENHM